MKTSLVILFTCISFLGIKAQNYPGYKAPVGSFCVGMVGYAYYDLQEDEFVFDQTLGREISQFNLPFASIQVNGSHLRFVVSKADFKEYFLNPAVKGQTYFDLFVEFSDSPASPNWSSSGQNVFGYIMLMFPKQ